MTEFVLSEIREKTGCITLNRQFSINALNLDMIRELTRVLKQWENEPKVEFILLEGAGEKGFCAGGDIKMVYMQGKDALDKGEKPTEALQFFTEEYALNKMMHHYKKPIVVYMEGICMGGGLGLAFPCQYRIGADNLKLAMPETGIGFFPDVGAAYYLNKLPYNAGMHIALSGATLGPDKDLFAALGIVTHTVDVAEWESIKRKIIWNGLGELELFKADPRGGAGFIKFLTKTADVWTKDTFEELIRALMTAGHEKAPETAQMIVRRSPHSLARTFQHMRWAADKSLDEVIAQDAKLAEIFLSHPDFYEGIRATVVAKDKNPKWIGKK